MINYQISLLLLLVIGLVGLSIGTDNDLQQRHPLREDLYKRTYLTVNKELERRASKQSDEPVVSAEHVIKIALDWLIEETNQGKVGMFKEKLVGALRQFTALNKVLSGECDFEDYVILSRNARAMPSETDLVKKTWRYYSLKHSELCLDLYPSIYKSRYEKTLDETMKERVETFLGPIIEERAPKSTQDQLFEVFVISQVKPLSESAEAANKVLNSKLLEKPESNLRQFYEEHLVQPCAYYYSKLSPLFEPALYDALSLQRAPAGQIDSGFELAWAHFRLCQRLVATNNDRESLFEALQALREVK